MTDINTALAQILGRRPAYQLYADYYEGSHRLAFATEKFRNAFGALLKEFACNLCPGVVDVLADRLEVTGFGVETSAEGDGQGPRETAWRLWEANRMDVRAGEVHEEALRSGDAYVIVWPDASGQPTIYPQRAERMAVQYDEETPGRVLWAAKAWRDETAKRWRLNLYYPDRIEKYESERGGDLPEKQTGFRALDGEETVPNPWGVVPVFHFANAGPIGGMGRSELRNVIPLQDALNKAVCDLLVGMEFHALPQRWATGIEVELDPVTGKPKTPFTPGGVWTAGDPEAKFGEFPGADLAKLLEVMREFALSIARVSGTPPHYMQLLTDPPSGEALKTLEARFVKKALRRQTAFGDVWEAAVGLALRQAGQAEARLDAQWIDPAPKSERETAETVRVKQDVGISKRQALKELGYGKDDVETMLQERQEDAERAVPALGSPFARRVI